MKQFFKTFLLMTSVFCAVSVGAADPFSVYRANAPEGCLDKEIGKNPLTLSDLVAIGICHNPTLSKEFMSVKIQEAGVGKTKAAYLPRVEGTAGAAKESNKVEGSSAVEDDPLSVNVALSWLLFDFGGRKSTKEQAKAFLKAAEFNYNTALQDMIFSIAQAYYDLLGNRQVLKSTESSEASYKKSFEEAARRYDLGLIALSDKLLAETSYEQSRLSTIQAKNNVEQSQGRLALLLNLPPQTTFDLLEPTSEKGFEKLPTDKTIQELIDIALENRSEIKSAGSRELAAKLGIKIARSSGLPSVLANASGSMGNDWKQHQDSRFGAKAGVAVNVPFFTGFSDTYKVGEAEYTHRQAEANLQEVKNTVRQEVWSAYQNYKASVSAYDISKKVVASAKENERLAFESYKIGKADILNLLTANSQLAQAYQENAVAFYNILMTKAKLYRTIGRTES